MVSAEPQPIEFAPLRGFDAEDAHDAFLGEDIEEGTPASRQSTSREKESFLRAAYVCRWPGNLSGWKS